MISQKTPLPSRNLDHLRVMQTLFRLQLQAHPSAKFASGYAPSIGRTSPAADIAATVPEPKQILKLRQQPTKVRGVK